MELRTLPACLLPRPKSENNFASQELSREGRRIFHKSDTFHKDSNELERRDREENVSRPREKTLIFSTADHLTEPGRKGEKDDIDKRYEMIDDNCVPSVGEHGAVIPAASLLHRRGRRDPKKRRTETDQRRPGAHRGLGRKKENPKYKKRQC
ncbi:hypothetical protein E2986_11506 [Frieseomelitta varia]|uniref:Uncharacterized protein n=1 Tax=Frieseomelitta varia TaxID=561572 RepID=A0A833S3H4_9HYME|nr:hypothetical protein E2986_11506 [Frieseomelitta varia]